MPTVARKTTKRNYRKEVSSVLTGICLEHQDDGMTLGEITELALKSNQIPQEYIDAVARRALKREISNLLRKVTLTKEDGTQVRQFLCFSRHSGGEQLHLWKDIRTLSHREMMSVVSDLDKHIQDSITQKNACITYWNENVRKKNEKQIQLDIGE